MGIHIHVYRGLALSSWRGHGEPAASEKEETKEEDKRMKKREGYVCRNNKSAKDRSNCLVDRSASHTKKQATTTTTMMKKGREKRRGRVMMAGAHSTGLGRIVRAASPRQFYSFCARKFLHAGSRCSFL